MLVDSLMPSRPIRVADELGVSGSEIPRLYVSLGGGCSAVVLIEGLVENLGGLDLTLMTP